MAPVPVELSIDRLSKLGEGVASHQGRTVFVEGALPGERVRAALAEDGRVLRGAVLEIIQPSPARRSALALCPASERCGGCEWMHLDEEAQRAAKLEILLSALEHLGRIPREAIEIRPMISSPSAVGYRRRAVLHFARGKLAYHARRSHEPVWIDRCPALVGPLADLPGALSEAFAPMARDTDELHLLAEGPQAAAALMLQGPVRERHRALARAAVKSGLLAGVVLAPREGAPERVGGPALRSAAPLAPEVPLYLSPDAFTQANAFANEALVAAALALLAPGAGERGLELYCGNGNFTFGLARQVASLLAVESSRSSLELARRSAREAGLSHLRFVEGDARKVVEGLIAEGQRFDLLLADPPRAGARGIGGWARRLGARSVAYVACDPASLARDAAELQASGYRPRVLQGVDMFPQTRHVEAVMSFTRAEGA